MCAAEEEGVITLAAVEGPMIRSLAARYSACFSSSYNKDINEIRQERGSLFSEFMKLMEQKKNHTKESQSHTHTYIHIYIQTYRRYLSTEREREREREREKERKRESQRVQETLFSYLQLADLAGVRATVEDACSDDADGLRFIIRSC